jgi:hypothetical protein
MNSMLVFLVCMIESLPPLVDHIVGIMRRRRRDVYVADLDARRGAGQRGGRETLPELLALVSGHRSSSAPQSLQRTPCHSHCSA